MNPITNAKNLQKLNQRELELGVTGRNKKSWHDQYKDSAWIFIGGLPYDLTEGDIICIFSQYGEVVNINLVRDKSTGKSKGYSFLCYEDQRSTILAVDNLNTIKVLGRIIRVDHVSDYKKPKEKGEEDEITLKLRAEGCAPTVPPTPPSTQSPSQLAEDLPLSIRPPPAAIKPKKAKKDKKKDKKKKKKKKKMKVTVKVEQRSESDSSCSSSEGSSDEDGDDRERRRKRRSPAALLHPEDLKCEKEDRGYDRALHGHRSASSPSRRGREKKEDVRPDTSLLDSRHRARDPSKDELGDRRRENVVAKREPPDPGRHRDEGQDERRDERREHRPRDRDEDRDRRDRHRREDQKDHRRDRDDRDRTRR